VLALAGDVLIAIAFNSKSCIAAIARKNKRFCEMRRDVFA
jgi:hypothetical protein